MESVDMAKKPTLRVVQPDPVDEMSIKDLIARFESDIRFDQKKPSDRYERSDAAKELVKRGAAAAKAIKRYLEKKDYENLDAKRMWKLLRDDVAKANPEVTIPEVLIPKEK